MTEPAAHYFLKTRRLGFRAWRESDLELALGLWGEPEVTRWIGGPFSPREVEDRLAREIRAEDAHGVQYWPIFLLSNDDVEGPHLGCCGLRPYREETGVYELGFHLCRPFWGQGYAAEAARAVIDYAFTTLEARALFAGHHPQNEPSRRLLSRLGFTYTHDEFYPPTGLPHPSYILRKTA